MNELAKPLCPREVIHEILFRGWEFREISLCVEGAVLLIDKCKIVVYRLYEKVQEHLFGLQTCVDPLHILHLFVFQLWELCGNVLLIVILVLKQHSELFR